MVPGEVASLLHRETALGSVTEAPVAISTALVELPFHLGTLDAKLEKAELEKMELEKAAEEKADESAPELPSKDCNLLSLCTVLSGGNKPSSLLKERAERWIGAGAGRFRGDSWKWLKHTGGDAEAPFEGGCGPSLRLETMV